MTSFEYTNEFPDVTSEVVNWVHYNKNTRVLAVTTLNGSTYMYSNVSKNEYENFRNSGSRGKFWNCYIKPVYSRTPESKNGALSNVDFIQTSVPTETKNEPVVEAEAFAVHKPTGASFEVVVELNGTLTIKGEAPTGEAAIAQITQTLNENFKGNFKVRELKQKFD
jgi:hypothetical protein